MRPGITVDNTGVKENNGIYIGSSTATDATWYNFTLPRSYSVGDVNVTALAADVKALKQTVDELIDIVSKQSDTITTLWYHPNGPGGQEAKDSFQRTVTSLTQVAREPEQEPGTEKESGRERMEAKE